MPFREVVSFDNVARNSDAVLRGTNSDINNSGTQIWDGPDVTKRFSRLTNGSSLTEVTLVHGLVIGLQRESNSAVQLEIEIATVVAAARMFLPSWTS
jgi:hypothetical protein